MITQLTSRERQYAAVILLVVAMAGIAMAALGKSDPLGIHGVITLIYSGVLLYIVISSFYEPEPQMDRQASYYDDPIKVAVALSMAWAVFGMFMGVLGLPPNSPGPISPSTQRGRPSDGCGRPTPPASFSASAAMH